MSSRQRAMRVTIGVLAATILTFSGAALAQESRSRLEVAHQRCTHECRVELVECEEGCNRSSNDPPSEVACFEGCYVQNRDSCMQGCRELADRLLRSSR